MGRIYSSRKAPLKNGAFWAASWAARTPPRAPRDARAVLQLLGGVAVRPDARGGPSGGSAPKMNSGHNGTRGGEDRLCNRCSVRKDAMAAAQNAPTIKVSIATRARNFIRRSFFQRAHTPCNARVPGRCRSRRAPPATAAAAGRKSEPTPPIQMARSCEYRYCIVPLAVEISLGNFPTQPRSAFFAAARNLGRARARPGDQPNSGAITSVYHCSAFGPRRAPATPYTPAR